jgi:hypothetical protein
MIVMMRKWFSLEPGSQSRDDGGEKILGEWPVEDEVSSVIWVKEKGSDDLYR